MSDRPTSSQFSLLRLLLFVTVMACALAFIRGEPGFRGTLAFTMSGIVAGAVVGIRLFRHSVARFAAAFAASGVSGLGFAFVAFVAGRLFAGQELEVSWVLPFVLWFAWYSYVLTVAVVFVPYILVRLLLALWRKFDRPKRTDNADLWT